jgi:hypothetical protein
MKPGSNVDVPSSVMPGEYTPQPGDGIALTSNDYQLVVGVDVKINE